MGDDTWMTVFPSLFAPNMTFPYDSFNVEDLHTVDEGVIRHLFPLLEDKSGSWDAIIGHFLGVDHVGHRVGPDQPTMKAKLTQMNDVLRRVVELLEEDTLLVVLGDHGMNKKGDHGGDGDLETSSAMWIYSKGTPLLSQHSFPIPSALQSMIVFPDASVPHRSIQQIDLVPTISLLLGLPIPFNNLGTVIPELFSRSLSRKEFALDRAMQLNANQIKAYLGSYRESASGGELDAVWDSLESTWAATTIREKGLGLDLLAHHAYTRYALAACRSLWAQFDVVLMTLGLVVLCTSLCTAAILYSRMGQVTDWEKWASKRFGKIVRYVVIGAVMGPVIHFPLRSYVPGVSGLHAGLFASSIASCATLLVDSLPALSLPSLLSLPLPLILHTLAFLSNSFTFWEDRIVLFLLLSSLVPTILTGITAPIPRLRYRILGYSALYALCIRLMAISTVCREEQQPYCHVTFYASSSLPSPPLLILILAVPTSLALPYIIRHFLAISSSDKGLVPGFLSYVLRPALLAGNACWAFEWFESSEIIGSEWAPTLRTARTVVARCTIGGLLFGAPTLWWINPLCVELQVREDHDGLDKKRQISVLGFSNAYGSPFILFWCIFLALLYTVTQLTGQVVLALAAVALLAHLEVTDSVRDVRAFNMAFASGTPSAVLEPEKLKVPSAPFTFAHLSTFALLALHTFHGTGHQATPSSLQWKTAFLLTPTLAYPISPLLVVLNTFGPHFLFALATPLVACWQFAPRPQPASRVQVIGGSVRASLGVMLYFCTLLIGSAASSAWLRRHLMVWKVFAPRFMAAAAGLLVVDLAVVLAVGVGVARTSVRVGKLFEKMG